MIASLVSSTGAIADITPVKGDLTSKFCPSSTHFDLIDKESFPTGIEISSSQQIFDKASTPSLNAKSSLLLPQAAIQLADNTTRSNDFIGALIRLKIDSARAIRIEALGFEIAIDGFSPIEIASP